MVFITTTLILLMSFSSAVFSEERFLLPNGGDGGLSSLIPSISNIAQSFQLPGASNNNGEGASAQTPFQLPQIPQFPNLAALFANISQALNISKPQLGQPTPTGTQRQLPNSIPPKPVYTTLPFNELNAAEFSWLWENLSQLAESQTNTNAPSPKFFGNAGPNATLGDLNFLTLPQLFNIIGG